MLAEAIELTENTGERSPFSHRRLLQAHGWLKTPQRMCQICKKSETQIPACDWCCRRSQVDNPVR